MIKLIIYHVLGRVEMLMQRKREDTAIFMTAVTALLLLLSLNVTAQDFSKQVITDESIAKEVGAIVELVQSNQGYSASLIAQRYQMSGNAEAYEKILSGVIGRLRASKNYEGANAFATYLVNHLEEKGRFADAIKTAISAADDAKVSKKDLVQAGFLSIVARLSSRLGNWKASAAAYESVIALDRRSGKPDWALSALNGLGWVLAADNRPMAGLEKLNEAIELAASINSKLEAGTSHRYKGLIYLNYGVYGAAYEEYLKSTYYIDEKDPFEEMWIRFGLAEALVGLGRAEESIPHYERAIVLSQKLNLSKQEFDFSLNLGIAFGKSKRYVESERQYSSLATLARVTGDVNRYAEALNAFGYYLLIVRRFDIAYDTFSEVLQLTDDSSFERLVALEYLGDLYLQIGKADESLAVYNRAEQLARKLEGDDVERPWIQMGKAAALGKLGRHGEAAKYFERLLKRGDFAPMAEVTGEAFLKVGEWEFDRGNYVVARSHFQAAYQNLHINHVIEKEIYALAFLMKTENLLGNSALSILYGKRLINVLQDARDQFKNHGKEFNDKLFEDKLGFYRLLADVLIENGRLLEAEQVLGMLKEDEYVEFIRGAESRAAVSGDGVALSRTENEILGKVNEGSERVAEAARAVLELRGLQKLHIDKPFPQSEKLKTAELKLKDEQASLRLAWSDMVRRAGQNRESQNDSEQEVFAEFERVKDGQTAVVVSVVGKNSLRLILTTSRRKTTFRIPVKSNEVNQLVLKFRSDLTNATSDPRPSGKALYSLLFPAELREFLRKDGIETILWSLDGTLRYVPIAALWDGDKYVVEDFSTAILTRKVADRPARARVDRSSWTALGVGISRDVTVKEPNGKTALFPALFSVPQELCGIIIDDSQESICSEIDSRKGALAGKVLLDNDFNESNFLSSVQKFPILHIASHFNLNAGNDGDSYLVIGGDQNRLSLQSIRENPKGFSGLELLTLSACNTAVGSGLQSNGLEVEGFGVLAISKGARSVVASLWAVSDTSTKELMVDFYQRLAKSNASKAQAIRESQLFLLRSRFSHPYYWSPFVLFGDTQ